MPTRRCIASAKMAPLRRTILPSFSAVLMVDRCPRVSTANATSCFEDQTNQSTHSPPVATFFISVAIAIVVLCLCCVSGYAVMKANRVVKKSLGNGGKGKSSKTGSKQQKSQATGGASTSNGGGSKVKSTTSSTGRGGGASQASSNAASNNSA